MLIISSCTARKDDSIPIPEGARIVQPTDYLRDKLLVEKLLQIRQQVFDNPKANLGGKTTYAYDLYMKGNAYREIDTKYYRKIKSFLFSAKINWFYLSGGYGIINALEPAKKYQATFSQSIAHSKKIPYTAKLWGETLIKICGKIIEQNPDRVYVFGSQDYTAFIKRTQFWKSASKDGKKIKIFESTGSAGPFWISKLLGELAEDIEKDKVMRFDEKYPSFLKQKGKN